MTDQPSNSGDDEYGDDDFDYSEEYWEQFREDIRRIRAEWGDRPHLISVDQLREAGALDVPPGWRKSLSAKAEQLPLFGDDDEEGAEAQDEWVPG